MKLQQPVAAPPRRGVGRRLLVVAIMAILAQGLAALLPAWNAPLHGVRTLLGM